MRHHTLIWISLLFVSLLPLKAQKVTFPSDKHSSTDPSKRYSVIWIEATDSTEHQLLLKNLATGQIRKIQDFGRSIDLYWAPDAKAFAITDWAGSDYSRAWVGFPEDSTRSINLDVT